MIGPSLEAFATHYRSTRQGDLLCCGCILNRIGSRIACLIWAGLSIYFATMAFMGSSPFYSHIQRAPLIIFGVINLLFGIITLIGFAIMIRPLYLEVKHIVHVITIGAIIVAIDMLANFILFAANPGEFHAWCMQTSWENAHNTLVNEGVVNGTSLASGIDHYNCDRLFNSQVKWSLLCVITMVIVYTHWVLVCTSFAHTGFFFTPPIQSTPIGPAVDMSVPAPTVAPTEYGNLAPHKYSGKDRPGSREKQRVDDITLLSMLGLEVDEEGQIISMKPLNEQTAGYGQDFQYRAPSRSSDKASARIPW